ncbi:MAG TPA: hypothetical protein VF462_14915 [Micromonosporaceae bacterium]
MAYRPPLRHSARRHQPLRLTGLVAGIALLFCVVGAAGLGAWNLQSVHRASGPARDAAEAFLRAVAAGDTTGAYNQLCPDTRGRIDRDGFARKIRALPAIRRYQIQGVSVATNRREMKGTVTAEVTWATGVLENRKLTMVTIDGKWRVCGDPV